MLETLISTRLENCDSMEIYINQVIETAQKLRKTGFNIDEEWIGFLLLAGLPNKYSPMVMAIEHSGIHITTDSIKCKLLDMSIDIDNKGGAFGAAVKFRKNPRDGASKHKSVNVKSADICKQKDMAGIICFRCKKAGHYILKCPNVQNSVKLDTKNALNAVFLGGNFSKEDFYLDSGAGSHMTPNEN